MRITVQPGREIPYAIDSNKFYVRDESETNLDVRDEIVRLVERGLSQKRDQPDTVTISPAGNGNGRKTHRVEPPRTGVEVVSSEKRKGTIYHTVRDMRNGNLIKNVTKSSARKLWHYAITQAESGSGIPDAVRWYNNMAVLNVRKKGDNVWYDLALRDGDQVHVYYGVTDSGLNDEWLALVSGTDGE